MIILPKDLDIKSYHNYPAITSSKLRKFLDKPYEYEAYYISKTHPDLYKKRTGRHFELGQLFEDMITLTIEELGEIYYFCKGGEPEKPSSAVLGAAKPSEKSKEKIKKWNTFVNQTMGKEIISRSECDMMKEMMDGFYTNDDATKLWANCEYQPTIRREIQGQELQCRFDGLCVTENYAVDIKTTSKSLEEFSKAIVDYRYDLQLAFYSELYRLEYGKELDEFYFIVSETCYPYRTQVMTIPRSVKDLSKEQMVESVTDLIECLNTNQFPKTENKTQISIPNYQLVGMGFEI